jgi:hypothetical protein
VAPISNRNGSDGYPNTMNIKNGLFETWRQRRQKQQLLKFSVQDSTKLPVKCSVLILLVVVG